METIAIDFYLEEILSIEREEPFKVSQGNSIVTLYGEGTHEFRKVPELIGERTKSNIY